MHCMHDLHVTQGLSLNATPTQFYAGLLYVRPWSRFNWKPYWPYNPEATIMHWHGPKPSDYESMRATDNISNPVSLSLSLTLRASATP